MEINVLRQNINDFVKDNLYVRTDPLENPKFIIWANQNRPQPRPPYATLNIISGMNKLGDDTLVLDQVDDKYIVDGIREFTLSIQVRGKDALQIASDFSSRLEMPEVEFQLREKELGIANVVVINDLTELRNTTYEDVRVIDVMFYINSSHGGTPLKSDIKTIESIEGEFEMESDSGTTITEELKQDSPQ